MADLKAHAPAASDLTASDGDRGESGAGIVVVILACLLVLGLIGGVVVVGFLMYATRTRQLAEERTRLVELAEMERMQAQVAAQQAHRNAAEALANLQQAREAASALPPEQPPGPSPEERFQAEIEPLNQAVQDRPDDPQVWLQRARALHRWRKWREAAEDYERFLESNAGHVWVRLEAAAMRFAAGDREGYLGHCRVIEERLLAKTPGTVEHNRAARVLSLAPGALTQGDFFLVTAQEAPLREPGKIWLVEPMLALQYRTGRYEEALQTLAQARSIGGSKSQRAAVEIWGAMTYHQLGRSDEARAALATAEEIIASGLAPPGTEHAGSDVIVVCLHVIDEAKQLIAGPQPLEEQP